MYDFTHDKLRETAYEQTSLARRRLLHQRAADLYAGQARQHPENAALAGFHYRQAGQFEQAAHWFALAGENDRGLYANQDAINHFQNALACGHPQPEVLHEAIGELATLSGRYAEALTHFEAAAALCPPQRLPWIEHKLGTLHNQMGNFDLAECHLRAALDALESDPDANGQDLAERAMLLADWSQTVYRRGEGVRALELALQAVHLAQESQYPQALAQAFNNLGILERVNGQYSDAIQHLQNSLEIATKLADLGPRAAALNNLARVYAESGQLEHAIQLTQQALAVSEQRGDRHRAAALLNNLADLHHTAGNEVASMEYLRKAVVIFTEIDAKPAPGPGPESAEPSPKFFPEIWKLSEW